MLLLITKRNNPIVEPTVGQLIRLSLDEKNMSQKLLVAEIDVSPSCIVTMCQVRLILRRKMLVSFVTL